MKNISQNLKSNAIIMKRKREEEINKNYTKIYDLSKLDKYEIIPFEEKRNILITIKKILLATNDYIKTCNYMETLKYIIISTMIFLFFITLYCPIYNFYYFSSGKELFEESTLFQKIYCFYFFEVIEVIFRITINHIKVKKVKKVMNGYAKCIIYQNQKDNNFNIYIDDKSFDLYIMKREFYKNIFKNEEKTYHFLNNIKNNFYQYVIIYPNVRYYNWDRKILNEKENEIADNIIQTIQTSEKEHVKKYGFSIFIVWALYFFSFNNLIKGNKLLSLFFRFINCIYTKIVSIFLTNSFKNALMEKEEILSKQYIQNGYFIILNFCTIQIFKLNDGYVDNTLNIDEIYKTINKDVGNLNQKIIENFNY